MTFDAHEQPPSTRVRAAPQPREDGGPAEAGRMLRLAPRSRIILEGDPADTVFQIVSGTAMLYKLLPDGRRQVVEILRAGDVFGGPPSGIYDVSAEALTSVQCAVYLPNALARSPELMSRLSARLHAQISRLHEHVTLLGCKSSMERIATFLMRFVPERGGHGCPGPPAGENRGEDRADVRLTMMRHVVADYLGLTIETVSRSLAWLKRRGIVSISKIDEIRVHDVCELCRLTGTQATCDAAARQQPVPRRRPKS